jgi:hypothetical protein
MSQEKFSSSAETGLHHTLARMAGNWSGTTKTWFEPGILADESPIQGSMKSILGGRFLMWEYQGSLKSKPHEGVAIFGYDLTHGTLQSAWVDSFHMGTGMLFSEGLRQEQAYSVTGKYRVPESPEWGWRTTLELRSDNELVIAAYNISPEGQEDIATESILHRG